MKKIIIYLMITTIVIVLFLLLTRQMTIPFLYSSKGGQMWQIGVVNTISPLEIDTNNIYSYREPFFIGEHDVILENEFEIITFTHKVLNRNIFAIGALKAARWLLNQKNGLYSFEDVYNE